MGQVCVRPPYLLFQVLNQTLLASLLASPGFGLGPWTVPILLVLLTFYSVLPGAYPQQPPSLILKTLMHLMCLRLAPLTS